MTSIARKFPAPWKLFAEKSENDLQGLSNLVAESSIDGTLFLIDPEKDLGCDEPMLYSEYTSALSLEKDGPFPSPSHMTKKTMKRPRHEIDTDDTCRRRPPSPCPSLNFSQISRFESLRSACEMDFSEPGSPAPPSSLQVTDLTYCSYSSPRDTCMMETIETSSPTPLSPSLSSSLACDLDRCHISSPPGSSSGTLLGPFLCNVSGCNKAFTKKWNLEQHCRRVHSYEKPYQCHYQDCSLSFAIKSDCVRHYKTHLQERPHRCRFCGNGFERRDRLRDHLHRIHKVGEE